VLFEPGEELSAGKIHNASLEECEKYFKFRLLKKAQIQGAQNSEE
jgi:hypothetical protein